jgi:alkanesulfonate monooxygenase SsuD/methylene tetrahydromethanopterin reductase-like flavin-dependent oxidoreductase (luciferase family)
VRSERYATGPGPIGLILPTFAQEAVPPWADPSGSGLPPGGQPAANLAAVCSAAEEAGATALWACDHLFWHRPSIECLVALTVAATATQRVALGSCVIQLPLRSTPGVAKQAASLQTLSGGRLVLGVGVGSHAGEYEQSGVDYHRRGRLLDAGIVELRRCWDSGQKPGGGNLEAEEPGRYRQLPAPAPVPVWVGGSSEAALQRAASLGDGWMPLYLTLDEYSYSVERLAKKLDLAGRSSEGFVRSIVLFVSIDDDPECGHHRGTAWMSSFYGIPARAFDRHIVSGTAADVAKVTTDYLQAGADHVAVFVADDRPLDQFERLMSALVAAGVPARG